MDKLLLNFLFRPLKREEEKGRGKGNEVFSFSLFFVAGQAQVYSMIGLFHARGEPIRRLSNYINFFF